MNFLGRNVLMEAVGGCSCHWAYMANREFVGWYPPGGDMSQRRAGHYRGKARRAKEERA